MSSDPPPQPPDGTNGTNGTNTNGSRVSRVPPPAPRRRAGAASQPAANGAPAGAPAQPARRQIRGPHSALTDYLATHNIDATRIRRTAEDRRLAAERAREEADAARRAAQDESSRNATEKEEDVDMKDAADDDFKDEEDEDEAPMSRRRTRASAKFGTSLKSDDKAKGAFKKQTPKQKAAETARLKALAKDKASKRFQGQRKREGTEDSENSDEAAENFLDADDRRETQYEDCEKCGTKFVVTFYSRSGPNGGLLCSKCSKELDDADRAKRRKKGEGRVNRRNIESSRLEGKTTRGASDLLTMSLNTLAKHIDAADELGELPTKLVDRLAQILSKNRRIDPKTLNLFLNPSVKELKLYDVAKLKADDFIKIFQMCPHIEKLSVRCAIQFKGPVMKYLVDSPVRLASFSIHGANLLDDGMWLEFFKSKGQYLRELKVYYTDVSFGDEILEVIAEYCTELRRLKVEHNQQVTDAGLLHIAKLKKLEHLGLDIYKPTTTAPYVGIIKSIGSTLRTLSLANIDKLSDEVLVAIHDNCSHLTKLRLKKNECFTDLGFQNLFTNWKNRPLEFVDLGECRHLDSQVMDNADDVGLCSGGFKALMAHSRETLRYLNLLSCRHISNEAFIEVFNAKTVPAVKRSHLIEDDIPAVPGKVYPKLETMDLSFCQQVDSLVVEMIWQSCPNIKNLKVFGNFGVKKVRVPRGRILSGHAHLMGLEYEGEDSDEEL